MTAEADEAPGQTSFWRTAAVYTGGAMALQALNLLLAPVFTHVMTTEELGLAANYLFWAALFGLVIGLQLHGSLNNAVTEHGAGSAIDFIRSVLPLYTVPTAVLVAVLLAAPGWWEAQLGLPWRWLLIAIANGVLFAMVNMASVHAVISGRRGRYLAFTFVSTLGAAVLALVLMKFLDDAALARILGYVLAGAVAVMIAAPSPRRSWGTPQWAMAAFALPISLPLLAHEILYHVTNNANRVVILAVDGAGAAGVFAFAATLGGAAALTAAALNVAWTPWYFSHTKSGHHDEVRRAASDLAGYFALAMAVAVFVSPELLRLVAARPYWGGASILPVFLVIGTLTLIFNLCANFIVYRRRTRLVLAVSLLACLANVSLSIWFARVWGPEGVAAATLIATAILATGAIVVSWAIGCRNLPFRRLVAAVVGVLAALALTEALMDRGGLRWLFASVLLGWWLIGIGRTIARYRSRTAW